MQSLPLATTTPPLARIEAPVRSDLAALAATTVVPKGIAPSSFESVFEDSEATAQQPQTDTLDVGDTDVSGKKEDQPDADKPKPATVQGEADKAEAIREVRPRNTRDVPKQDSPESAIAAPEQAIQTIPKNPRQPLHALEQQLTSESEFLKHAGTQKIAESGKSKSSQDAPEHLETMKPARLDSPKEPVRPKADTPILAGGSPEPLEPAAPQDATTLIAPRTLVDASAQRATTTPPETSAPKRLAAATEERQVAAAPQDAATQTAPRTLVEASAQLATTTPRETSAPKRLATTTEERQVAAAPLPARQTLAKMDQARPVQVIGTARPSLIEASSQETPPAGGTSVQKETSVKTLPHGVDLARPGATQFDPKAPVIQAQQPVKAASQPISAATQDGSAAPAPQTVVVSDKTTVAQRPIRADVQPQHPRTDSQAALDQKLKTQQNNMVKPAMETASAAPLSTAPAAPLSTASNMPRAPTPKQDSPAQTPALQAVPTPQTDSVKSAIVLSTTPSAQQAAPNTGNHQTKRQARDQTALPLAPAPRLTMTPATNSAPVQWVAQTQPILTENALADRSLAEPVFTTSRADGPSHQHLTQTPIRTELPPQTVRQLAEVVAHMPNKPVEITLSPEELGRVRLTVRATDAGVTVHLLADRPETLDLMRRHIDQLGHDFEALGYENIAFSFADSSTNTDSDGSETPDGDADATPFLSADAIPDSPQISLNNMASSGLDMRL